MPLSQLWCCSGWDTTSAQGVVFVSEDSEALESGIDLNCHDPDCYDDADELARDTIFGLKLGFCEDHIDEWAAKDNVERGGV